MEHKTIAWVVANNRAEALYALEVLAKEILSLDWDDSINFTVVVPTESKEEAKPPLFIFFKERDKDNEKNT